MSTGPKGQWGGSRPGSGPKKAPLPRGVDQMLETADRHAAKHGKSMDDILCEVVYAQGVFADVSVTARLRAIEMFKKYTTPTEKTVRHVAEPEAPVMLPEKRPDAAEALKH